MHHYEFLQQVELGREPTPFELFTKTHFDNKKGEFVDQRSTQVHVCIDF